MKTLKKTLIAASAIASVMTLAGTAHGQTSLSEIYGDYNGGWTASKATETSGYSAGVNNMLGFEVGGVVYSTGVDNALLETLANGKNLNKDTTFKAMPIPAGSISKGNSRSESPLIGIGSSANPVPNPLSPAQDLASYLTDGENGLDLNSGIFNIPKADIQTSLISVDDTAIDDDIPDILVTQLGATGQSDLFAFYDTNDNPVGNPVNILFGNIETVPPRSNVTQSYALYWAFNNSPWSTKSGTRGLRIASLKLSEFGITAANAGDIAYFRQTTNGASDIAFIAYNTDSLSPATAALKVEDEISSPNLNNGDNGTYTATITNTSDKVGTTGLTTLTINVPAGLTVNPAAIKPPAGWTCTVSGQTVTCQTTNSIPKDNGNAKIEIPFTVNSPAATNLTFTTKANNGTTSNCASSSSTDAACTASKELKINGGAPVNPANPAAQISSVPTLQFPMLAILAAGLGYLGTRRRKDKSN